jgi:hypothetical protein
MRYGPPRDKSNSSATILELRDVDVARALGPDEEKGPDGRDCAGCGYRKLDSPENQ